MAGKCNYQADEFPFLVEADVSLALLSEDVQHFTEVLGLGRKFFCNMKRKKKKKKRSIRKRVKQRFWNFSNEEKMERVWGGEEVEEARMV